jgi:hypothetical protein
LDGPRNLFVFTDVPARAAAAGLDGEDDFFALGIGDEGAGFGGSRGLGDSLVGDDDYGMFFEMDVRCRPLYSA